MFANYDALVMNALCFELCFLAVRLPRPSVRSFVRSSG